MRQAAPPFLAARIVNAVRADSSSRGPEPRLALRRWAVGLGVAGLAALLTLKLVPWQTREVAHLASATNAATTSTTSPAVGSVPNLPFRLPDSASLMAYGARLDEPLEREWQHMVADAQAAARSLAANFIPDRPTDP